MSIRPGKRKLVFPRAQRLVRHDDESSMVGLLFFTAAGSSRCESERVGGEMMDFESESI